MANLLSPAGAIATLDQVRAEKCLKEIQDVLRRNQCQILPQILIVGSQIMQNGYIVVANTAVPPDLRGEKGNG